MRLLPVFLVFSLIEANRKGPHNMEKLSEDSYRKSKSNDVDVYPKSFQSVDFGHVYRKWNKDSSFKQPALEPDMIEPRNPEHARQLLKQAGSDVEWLKNIEEPLGFANPRDAMIYLNPSGQREGYETDGTANQPEGIRNSPQLPTQKTKHKPFDDESKQYRPGHSEIPETGTFYNETNEKQGYFSRSSFELLTNEALYKGNWTTCKEFAKGAVFHPDDVINIEWLPFYIWSTRRFRISHIHKFSYLTKKVVKEYKERYDPYLSIKVDWEEPKLLLKESWDLLLIAGDRKGLFYGIPIIDLPSSAKRLKIKIPVIVLRLKILDPYLALMYCNEHYAVIMGVAGTEPESDREKTAEASVLKFNGIGNPASRDIEAEVIREKYKKGIPARREEVKNFS